MPKQKLTNAFIKSLPAPNSAQVLYRDTATLGLALRVTKAGAKTFVFGYSLLGRERRMRIGTFPDWSTDAARTEARDLRVKVDKGIDPLDELNDARQAPTVRDLWEMYESDHLPSVSEAYRKEQIKYWERFVIPVLGKKRLCDLKSRDIDTLHAHISKSARVMANRVIASLRKALNVGKRNDWVTINVAQGARSNSEHGRERYLSDDELVRFVTAVAAMKNRIAANALTLLLLTGARRSEVFGAKWSEFDLQAMRWIKPADRMKTRMQTTVPLSASAVELLQQMKKVSKSDFLFPSKAGGAINDINKPWKWLMEQTGLADFRIHDLRHTHASILISQGQPLEVIGRLLGHSQPQTTARYAHLMEDPLRRAISGVDDKLAQAAPKNQLS